MSATPGDVQLKLDSAVQLLLKTSSSGKSMVSKYGSDPTKWPATSKWYQALALIKAAKTEAGQLTSPVLTAKFTEKVL